LLNRIGSAIRQYSPGVGFPPKPIPQLATKITIIAEPEHGKDAQYQFDTAAVICWRIEDAVFADRRIPAKE
jgi:hypothetical protein